MNLQIVSNTGRSAHPSPFADWAPKRVLASVREQLDSVGLVQMSDPPPEVLEAMRQDAASVGVALFDPGTLFPTFMGMTIIPDTSRVVRVHRLVRGGFANRWFVRSLQLEPGWSHQSDDCVRMHPRLIKILREQHAAARSADR